MPARSSRQLQARSAKSLNPVSDFRTSFAFVCKLRNQQSKSFGIARDAKRAGIHRIKPHVMNQPGRKLLGFRVVAAIDEAGTRLLTSRCKDVEENFAGHCVECGNNTSGGKVFCQGLRSR